MEQCTAVVISHKELGLIKSMNKLLTIFVLLLQAFSSKGQVMLGSVGNAARLTDIDFTGKTAVFFGNSITAGTFSSDPPNTRWAHILCVARGATEDNHGVNSMYMQASPGCAGLPAADPANVPTYNASIHCALFITFGVNDVGFNNGSFTTTSFKTYLTTYVTTALSKGWPANKILLQSVYHPFAWTTYIGLCTVSSAATDARAVQYNAKIAEVASENGCYYIDIYTPMLSLNSSFYVSDGLHPNDSGHSFIGNYLATHL